MVQVGVKDNSKEEAIRRIGELLVHGGYVNSGYIDGMFERESMTSTYIGMGIAVPHGTQESRKHVLHTGIVVVQYPEGIDFGEEKAYLIVGIAGTDDTHLDILSALSTVLAEEEILAKMKITNDPAFIYEKLIDIK
jgi:PTS system mannitol-specific IIC component